MTPIHDFLIKYADSGTVRCHMPGHKGHCAPLDITEIEGADSLYESGGIIAQSEREAARLFGVEKTLYSCSGSTLAINTMLALVKAYRDGRNSVTATRSAHRAFISSCIHLGLEPLWVYPERPLSAEISPDVIEKNITEQTAAVFVNSVDYYGGRSDISAIAAVCKKYGVPLLVDNAHGAYLKFTGRGEHPTEQGASMCADSAHKTLSVLTGGAYLHITEEKYAARAKEMMRAFGTSSPSYLILDSLDLFNGYIEKHPDAVKKMCAKIDALKSALQKGGLPLYRSDAFRVTVDCASAGSSGYACAEMLRRRKIECEYADARYCVLLFGLSTTDEDIKAVETALLAPDALPPDVRREEAGYIRTERVMPPREAFYADSESVSVKNAVGRVCAELFSPCPPGVPVIMPGELIDERAADILYGLGKREILAVR